MDVITIRVHDKVSRALEFLTKEKKKTKADLIRELMSGAVENEEQKLYLEKYMRKEITLRSLARRLGLPLWKAYELAAKEESPYSRADLQRDLKLMREG